MEDVAENVTARPQATPYDLLGGDAGVRRLCEAFYRIMDTLPEAATIRAMHKADLSEVSEKLYEFLSGWLGGPPLYMRKYRTFCLSKPHAPYAIDAAARDQWLMCMDRALDEVGASPEVKAMLKEPFFQIAEMMRNRR
jgi:hemoglobin